jgi:hypothetical protein
MEQEVKLESGGGVPPNLNFLYFCIIVFFVFVYFCMCCSSAQCRVDVWQEARLTHDLCQVGSSPRTQLPTDTSHPQKINEQAKWEIRGLSNYLKKTVFAKWEIMGSTNYLIKTIFVLLSASEEREHFTHKYVFLFFCQFSHLVHIFFIFRIFVSFVFFIFRLLRLLRLQ